MQFLNPWFFLLSIFIAAVILFYFFRKQYVEKSVSSNFLWEQVLNEWQASPWLKKLQQNLLFWLQLLALLLLMFSLVRPFWFENVIKGEHIIMIIDSSATMSAKFENSSRFEIAKQEMLNLVEKLEGQEVTLIKAGKKPEILLSHEREVAVIKKLVNSLQLSYEHEQMDKAMNLAASLSTEKDTSIHIFSDGVIESNVEEAMKDQYVVVHNVGEDVNNASLISFGVAPVDGHITGVALIENQTPEKIEIDFRIKSEGSELFEQQVTIEGEQRYVVQIPSLPEKPYYEAMIFSHDGYAADNYLTSIYTESNPKVYTVGEVNSFAIKGFQTIGAELLQTSTGSADFVQGILLTEGTEFPKLLEQPSIFFNTNNDKIRLSDPLAGNDDRLLQYVDYGKIYIESVSEELEGDWETILRSGTLPLIQKGQVNGHPIIIVNFSLADSDWPLQPSFPIFLYNAYDWLSKQTDFLGYFGPGEEKWLNIGQGNHRIEIFNNEDKNLYSLDLTQESFKAPIEPGTYQAVAGDKIYHFSVLLDEREKHPKVEAAFHFNEQKAQENGKRGNPNDKLWFWLALLAFGFIVLEWEVYRRGHRI
ncbi:BatA and WFA domain-containing protein [Bacillus sp. DTU_2020_1000418_1_SI_GHA_SEK_038]|uniref:vWA domain-containing protein n=1 Tax=Bacillus sp. DTU_2020_1000418_1_SI_GHA_SEK_038 TaxID=3077585 RepID=UPI0028E479A1|nr:BatA and WFA domain-containing protein [Bacillus sp. DTU_2020_1000418_1_SI_GHA_SEK_038]WNS77145.1 BatA and WFA domain-containing protein [Bacillus sp. DTU_2020_1000418_1_SI_GHA_SEK_038]